MPFLGGKNKVNRLVKFEPEETKNVAQGKAALELFYIDSRFVVSSGDHLMDSQEGIEYYLILCSCSLHSGFRRALPAAMRVLAESSLPSANTSLSSDRSYCGAILRIALGRPVRPSSPTFAVLSSQLSFAKRGPVDLITIARFLAASEEEEPAPEPNCLVQSQPDSRGSNHESSRTWIISNPQVCNIPSGIMCEKW